jgi:hypothetical protein
MPSQFTFYSNKNSEVLISNTSYGNTNISVVSANVLSSQSDSSVIGQLLVTKTNTVDNNNNVYANFEWQIQFNSNANVPPNLLALSFGFFNQTTSGQNPTEKIPVGQSQVVVTGGINSASCNGEYCNQFGYCNKTKYASSSFRQYDIYFPQLVASYTNVFNSLPQQNVAPLA